MWEIGMLFDSCDIWVCACLVGVRNMAGLDAVQWVNTGNKEGAIM